MSPNSLAIKGKVFQEILPVLPSQKTLKRFFKPSFDLSSFNLLSIKDIYSSDDIPSSFSCFFKAVRDFIEWILKLDNTRRKG